MNKIFFFISTSLIVSCHDSKQEANKVVMIKSSNDDSLWKKELHSYDTITSSGFIILYKIIDSNYFQISWGQKNNLHTYSDSFKNNIADARIPHLKFESKNFLILRYGCGNPCWGCIALPKDSVWKAQDIMYGMDYNYENDLLAYCNYEKKGLTMTVRNLRTEKEKDFLLCDTCFSAASEYCLTAIKLYSGKVYFQWNPNKNDSTQSKEKVFKLDF